MILYNVTVKIDQRVAEQWLSWMKETHIPDILATGFFTDHKICQILHEEEDGGITYAIQYFCRNMTDFQAYQKNHAKPLQQDHAKLFKDRYVAFRTIMKVLD